jgi:hypothetical protein
MAKAKTGATDKVETFQKKKSSALEVIRTTDREKRVRLIHKIEEMRKSKVIAYLTGDRVGTPLFQIGDDAIRPMYDHIRKLGTSSKLDLFLYSRGGGIEVPWRMVTMLREHCKNLSVLIPYRAYSAATLIALGCDEIVMGPKAELGPIDPVREFRINDRPEPISVEDVMSFSRFIKEIAGLTDQSAISDNIHVLTEKLSPWAIGSIYRIHTHIRIVAQKMLSSRTKSIDEATINRITETLAGKVYSHGHAISRKEAKDIGLTVIQAGPKLETLLWNLFKAYEELLQLKEPLDPHVCFPANIDIDEVSLPITTGIIESENITSVYNGVFKLRRIRKTPQQLNFNLNVGLQLPSNIEPQNIPLELKKLINETLEEIKKQAPKWIMDQTKKQSPIEKIELSFEDAHWRDATKINT